MNDNTPQPHRLWEIHAITHSEDGFDVFPSWYSFLKYWNDPGRWRDSYIDSEPPFERYYEFDPQYIQLMTLVRWHWVEDDNREHPIYKWNTGEPDEWLWDNRTPTQEEIDLDDCMDGRLWMTFFNGYEGDLSKIMVRVRRSDEPHVKAFLQSHLEFIVSNMWYPIQIKGRKVERLEDDYRKRTAAVQLWSDP